MLSLPKSTEYQQQLPKTQIYKKFELTAPQRDRFDADIARMDIVNVISPRFLPSIAEGNEVKAIFVVNVDLKRPDYDPKNISLIAKLIPQRIVFVLRSEDLCQLAIFHTKTFVSPWKPFSEATIELTGIDLDAVWENIVRTIGNITESAEAKTLAEDIALTEQRAKLEKQIATVEKQLYAERDRRRKRELFAELQRLKGGLNG